jgi:hypothetical protein
MELTNNCPTKESTYQTSTSNQTDNLRIEVALNTQPITLPNLT